MHVAATPDQARTILGAMRDVASTGGALSEVDRASIVAAARYIFRLDLAPDLAGLSAADSGRLRSLTGHLANEAVSFATVVAFVDGKLDDAKLKAVLKLAAALGVHDDFVDDVAEIARGHLQDATGHMIRANLESLTGRTMTTDEAMPWFLPYKAKPDAALAARFRALHALPPTTFGHTFAAFYEKNKYAFPGEEAALNFGFAVPHDSTHVLAGYDTTPRGEILTSTLTAAMHHSHAMSGHVLPVILSWHLGIALNEVAGAA